MGSVRLRSMAQPWKFPLREGQFRGCQIVGEPAPSDQGQQTMPSLPQSSINLSSSNRVASLELASSHSVPGLVSG